MVDILLRWNKSEINQADLVCCAVVAHISVGLFHGKSVHLPFPHEIHGPTFEPSSMCILSIQPPVCIHTIATFLHIWLSEYCPLLGYIVPIQSSNTMCILQ